MKCPVCSSGTTIYNTRSTNGGYRTWRRHRCKSCTERFSTLELIDWDGKTMISSDSVSEPYSRERLMISILRASMLKTMPRGSMTAICDTIETHLQAMGVFQSESTESSVITEVTIEVLSKIDKVLTINYISQVYKSNPPESILRKYLI